MYFLTFTQNKLWLEYTLTPLSSGQAVVYPAQSWVGSCQDNMDVGPCVTCGKWNNLLCPQFEFLRDFCDCIGTCCTLEEYQGVIFILEQNVCAGIQFCVYRDTTRILIHRSHDRRDGQISWFSKNCTPWRMWIQYEANHSTLGTLAEGTQSLSCTWSRVSKSRSG